MWWRFRLRAVSYIEVAISLFICGIIMNIGVNIVKNIQHHRMQVAIERAMHDISIAAAKYAACQVIYLCQLMQMVMRFALLEQRLMNGCVWIELDLYLGKN